MFRQMIHLGLWGSAVALFCLAYGFLIEPYRLNVRHITLASPQWSGAPLRIGVISDIHAGGRHVYAKRVAKVVGQLNAHNPDIILVAGDFTSSSKKRALRTDADNQAIDAAHAEITKLSAPLGVYAVLGNHDFLYGEDFTQSQFEAAGFTFLDNKAKIFEDRFCLFGIGDDYYGNPNRNGRDACPDALAKIGLMHNPDSFLLGRGGEALMVTGHTHGGQINLPVLGRVATATRGGRKLAYGRMTINGAPAYVTSGVGMSLMPARFRAPPEIVVITLTEPGKSVSR